MSGKSTRANGYKKASRAAGYKKATRKKVKVKSHWRFVKRKRK